MLSGAHRFSKQMPNKKDPNEVFSSAEVFLLPACRCEIVLVGTEGDFVLYFGCGLPPGGDGICLVLHRPLLVCWV